MKCSAMPRCCRFFVSPRRWSSVTDLREVCNLLERLERRKNGSNPEGEDALGCLAALLAPYRSLRTCSSLPPCHPTQSLLARHGCVLQQARKMSQVTRERLFGFRHAFDDRVTVVLTLTALTLFLLAPVLILIVTRAANSSIDKKKELWDRYRSWIWLALFILIPILAGAFWTILAVATLSFLCYREYARITGLFRERTISLIVVIGILLLTFCRAGQLVSAVCCLVSADSRADCHRRIDPRST